MRKLMFVMMLCVFMTYIYSCEHNLEPTYKINFIFESNGGSIIAQVTIDTLNPTSFLNVSLKVGYTFLGWFL